MVFGDAARSARGPDAESLDVGGGENHLGGGARRDLRRRRQRRSAATGARRRGLDADPAATTSSSRWWLPTSASDWFMNVTKFENTSSATGGNEGSSASAAMT